MRSKVDDKNVFSSFNRWKKKFFSSSFDKNTDKFDWSRDEKNIKYSMSYQIYAKNPKHKACIHFLKK